MRSRDVLTRRAGRRRPGKVAVTALLAALGLLAAAFAISPTTSATAVERPAEPRLERSMAQPKPTVVIVHGAFADASGFAATITALQADGYPVLAPPNPLRGLAQDAATLRTFLATVPGPVVLVGHSYGGAVITQAAQGNGNVVALVYLAAYGLDADESAGEANALGGGTTHLLEHLVLRPYPGAPAGDADGYIDPAWFQRIFAADVPRKDAAVMAATQRPAALSALVAKLVGQPAWKSVPSWYLVARQDQAIPPEAERAMAARMNAQTWQVDSSHAVMVSHPDTVTRLIEAAARATAGPSAAATSGTGDRR